jgi:chromosome segregation ATPase
MTTETNDLAGAGSEIVAPEHVETPEVTTPESNQEEQQPKEDTAKDDSDKTLKRLQRRIDRVTAARYQAEAEARQLRELVSRFEQRTQPEEVQQQIKPEDIDRLATQRAQEIAQTREMQARVNSVLEQGRAVAGFDDLCNTVNEEVAFYEDGKPTAFLEAVLDSDKPHELLTYLGQNPDIAESLSGLSAARLGRKLEAIEREMKSAKVSKAPAPLAPVKPKGASVAKPDAQMSDAEWYAQRRKR